MKWPAWKSPKPGHIHHPLFALVVMIDSVHKLHLSPNLMDVSNHQSQGEKRHIVRPGRSWRGEADSQQYRVQWMSHIESNVSGQSSEFPLSIIRGCSNQRGHCLIFGVGPFLSLTPGCPLSMAQQSQQLTSDLQEAQLLQVELV